jgi:hypothetical protein
MKPFYIIEIVDSTNGVKPEYRYATSEYEANAIAAERVKKMLEVMYDFTGDRPHAECWQEYLQMLCALAAGDGIKPLPNIKIRCADG